MAGRMGALGLAFGVACAAAGCGANISQPAPGPDCAAADGYAFPKGFAMDASTLDPGAAPAGFAFDDATPRGLLNGLPHVVVTDGVPGPPAGRAMDVDPTLTCGDPRVLDLQSSGHNDYGSSFFIELNGFTTVGLDATGATGISFWARSVNAASDKSVFVELSDRYTDSRGGFCVDTGNMTTDPAVMVTAVPGTGMGSGSTTLPFYVPGPHDCGNFYQRILQFTDVWTLYLLPFASFAQTAYPNRNPNGLDPSDLFSIGFQIPKEANFEIWIDQIAAYQPSSATAGP